MYPMKLQRKKNLMAIKEILNLSEENFLKTIYEENISACGYIPIAVTINACKNFGASKAELVEYQTSGDIIKDYYSVVGYGGIVIY